MAEVLVSVDIGEGMRGVVARGRRPELTVGLDSEPGYGTVASGEEPASMMVRRADRDVWIVGADARPSNQRAGA